jgi:hypothetical protein
MRTEGIGHMEISKDTTRNRTQKLMSFGADSQPTEPIIINLKDADKDKVALCLSTKTQSHWKTGGRTLGDRT